MKEEFFYCLATSLFSKNVEKKTVTFAALVCCAAANWYIQTFKIRAILLKNVE